MKLLLSSILATALVLLSFTAHAEEDPEDTLLASETPGVRISFLLYSGRPNPELFVSQEQLAARLVSMLHSLGENRSAATQAASPPRLGYTGIRFTFEGIGNWRGLQSWYDIKLYDGTIEFTSKNDTTRSHYVKDTGGKMKAFIMKLTRERQALSASEETIVHPR